MKNFMALLCMCVFLLSQFNLAGQDLSGIKDQKPIQVNGGLSLTAQQRSKTSGLKDQSLSAWAIGGNVNIRLYGLSIPLSFSLRDNNASLSNPFNRFGLSPTYKWIKVHAGYRSLQFSPYTYSGNTFLGAGVELNPGNFRFAAFSGTLQSFYPFVDTTGINSVPTFKRKAHGLKVGYGSESNHIDLHVFRANDVLEQPEIPDSLLHIIRPQNNLAFGISTKNTIAKRLRIEMNLAASSVTDDIRASTDGIDQKTLVATQAFQEINSTTRYAFAGDVSLQVSLNKVRLGATYKRIDPLYQSLGVYNILNDLQNITLNAGFNTKGGIFTFDGKVGLQKNNLKNYRRFTTNRTIISLSATVKPVESLTIRGQYSNFENERNMGLVNVEDTLRYASTTNQLQIFPQLRFGKGNIKHSITANYNQQGLKELAQFLDEERTTNTSYASLNYAVSFKEQAIRVKIGGHFNDITYNDRNSKRTGGQVSLRKSFADKKLTADGSVRYSKAKLNDESNGSVIHVRSGLTYKPTKKHRIFISGRYLIKTPTGKDVIKDFQGRIGYSFSF